LIIGEISLWIHSCKFFHLDESDNISSLGNISSFTCPHKLNFALKASANKEAGHEPIYHGLFAPTGTAGYQTAGRRGHGKRTAQKFADSNNTAKKKSKVDTFNNRAHKVKGLHQTRAEVLKNREFFGRGRSPP
jgi:hypothetical protein